MGVKNAQENLNMKKLFKNVSPTSNQKDITKPQLC